MGKYTYERKTSETDISLTLEIGGAREYRADTGCGFLNHMLELFAKNGGFGLCVTCRGDMEVDAHHTTEDVAIALGRAFREILGDCRGLTRYGSALIPMDEALVQVALDIGGRAALGYALEIPAAKVGDFDTELVREFMAAFSRSLGCALHLRGLAGENSHHIIEAAFKALGRAIKMAVAPDPGLGDEIPSTKGTVL